MQPLDNKALIWIKATLDEIIKAIHVKKIHPDNGSEFIKAHILRFCIDRKLEFARLRPYRKNDALCRK
ncbi:MAG: hypothetical protein N2511_07230 [Thermodesulfovibrionales bacterium]|nr:hypothetical protein [Thermodesulfovibrionales bacterium]